MFDLFGKGNIQCNIIETLHAVLKATINRTAYNFGSCLNKKIDLGI